MTQPLFNRYHVATPEETEHIRQSVISQIDSLRLLATQFQDAEKGVFVAGERLGHSSTFFHDQIASLIKAALPDINADLDSIGGLTTEQPNKQTGLLERVQLHRWTGIELDASGSLQHTWERHDPVSGDMIALKIPVGNSEILLQQ